VKHLTVAIAALAVLSGCVPGTHAGERSAASTPTTSAPASRAAAGPFCDLLTPADFAAVGVKAGPPQANDASPTQAYCVYGKDVEVDVFVDSTVDEAKATYQTAVDEGQAGTGADVSIPGVDESRYGTIPPGGSFGLDLRRKRLVVAIEVPAGTANPQVTLTTLAGELLGRASDIGE
jgi:hypothetical protein